MAAAARGVLLVAALLTGSGAAHAAVPWTEIPVAQRQPQVVLPDLAAIVQRAAPAVVSIVVEAERPVLSSDDPLDEFFDRYYGDDPAEGLGTGFLIRADGLILTNAHVVESGGKITIEVTIDGFPRRLPGKVLGVDPDTDLALLKIDAGRPLPVLPLGDSDSLSVADWVVAIGNPFGLSQSVTFGIVSQTGRHDVSPQGRTGYFDFIQTDASINPGNSGGPLLNLAGEVIAINNAINASGQGIGFAVPINMAKKVLPQLERDGHVTRAWIGVSIQDVGWDMASRLGLDLPSAVVISDVTPEGPAARAGLQVGDVVVRWNGRPVSQAHRLRWDVACEPVGRKVVVEVLRGGKRQRLSLTTATSPSSERAGMEMPTIHFLGTLGFAVEDTDEPSAVASGLPGPTGARIVAVDPEGVARRAGLQPGDIVLRLDGEPVGSAGDLGRRIAETGPGSMVELRVRREGEDLSVPVRVPRG